MASLLTEKFDLVRCKEWKLDLLMKNTPQI